MTDLAKRIGDVLDNAGHQPWEPGGDGYTIDGAPDPDRYHVLVRDRREGVLCMGGYQAMTRQRLGQFASVLERSGLAVGMVEHAQRGVIGLVVCEDPDVLPAALEYAQAAVMAALGGSR